MAVPSFIFDPSKGETPESVAKQREIAAAYAARVLGTAPKNLGEGINAIGQALIAAQMRDEAKAAQAAGMAQRGAAQADLAGLFGGASPTTPAPAVTPTAGAPSAAPPDNVAQIIAQNVPQDMQAYATNLIGKESSFRPDAVSPTGATGLAQFTRGTGRQYGLVTDQGDLRADPVKNVQALVALTDDNRQALTQALGRAPTDGELALAHQQGAQGAINLLSGRSVPGQKLAVNGVAPGTDPRAAASKIMAYYGGQGGQAPQAAAPVQMAALAPQTMTDASPAGAMPAQPAASPFAPEWNRDPSQFRQPAPAMSAMPLGMMSGGAFSGDATGSIPLRAAPQAQAPVMPPPVAPAPQAQPSPLSPVQMTPSTFEEAPGTLQASQDAPPATQQVAQALAAQRQGAAPVTAPQTSPAAPSPASAAAQQVAQSLPAQAQSADPRKLMSIISDPWADAGTKSVAQALLNQQLKRQQEASDPLRQLQIQKLQTEAGLAPLERQLKEKTLNKSDAPTAVQEYEFAKKDGYKGSFNDFKNQSKQRQFQAVQVQDGNGNTRTMFYNPETNQLQTQEQMGVKDASGPANPYAVGGKQTEQQGNAVGFSNRMVDAHNEINELEKVGTDASQSALSSIPGVGNYLVSPQKQKLVQAQRNFVNAILRKESGAAISASEFDSAAKQYFPQPGDSAEVIAQKRANREQSIKGIMATAGPNYKPPASFKPGEIGGARKTTSGVQWSVE